MKYLIDTDWVIDHLTERPASVQAMNVFLKEGVGISLITYGEVYEGILFGRNPEAAEAAFDKFLSWVNVVSLDRESMQIYARIRGDLRRRGRSLSDSDLLIAATAIQHDVALITRNLRHFERIDGLRIYRESK